MILAKEVKDAVSGSILKGEEDFLFSGISLDSRKIKKGELFWAIKGERFDGHDFVLNAIKRGAGGAVIDERHAEAVVSNVKEEAVIISVKDTLYALGDIARYWRKKHNPKVIAITGSSGKTTTKELLSTILSLRYNTLRNPGNYNNLIGLPISLLRLNSYHSIAVLEMGMNMPGEISRLTEIADPDIGIITNIGPVHLEGVKDIEGVARAKAELAEKISKDGIIFVNGDNELLLKEVLKFGKKVITFGKDKKNDIILEKAYFNKEMGIDFCMIWNNKKFQFRLNSFGLQNAMNAMIASAVALYLGISEKDIIEGLLSYKGAKGRFQLINLVNDSILIDDTYNSNPLSLKAAVDSLRYLRRGKSLIIGLGDMLELGDYSVLAHRQAAEMIAKLDPDLFIAMGDFSEEMIRSAKECGIKEENLFLAKDHIDMALEIERRVKRSKNCLVFLKASRAILLNKVAEYLVDKLGT